MRDEELGRLASRMVRDFTIIAKSHHDLARHYRAVAGTWRQVLDATPALLHDPGLPGSDGKAAAPPPSEEPEILSREYD